jgi:cell division protein FtsB
MVTWLVRLALAGVIAGALAYIPYRVYGSEGYVTYRRLGGQLDELRAGNAELERENARLEREIQALRTDPAAIGRVARDDLGMVAPGEIVLKLEPAPGEPAVRSRE